MFTLKKIREKKKVKEFGESHGQIWGINMCYSLISSHIHDH